MAALTTDQILDAISGMTVLECSELVKAMEEKFGVTAAVAVAAAPAAGACDRAGRCRSGWCPGLPRSAPLRRWRPASGLHRARHPSGGCGIYPGERE